MKILLIVLLLTGCAQQQTESFIDYMTPEQKAEWLKSYVSGIENNADATNKMLRQIQSNQIDSEINQLQILNAIKR